MEEQKDFEQYEQAYKKIKEQEAPDLWARIEAGIKAQEEISEGKSEEDSKKIVNIQEGKKKDTKKKKGWKSSKIMWISGVSAAVLAFVIGIPAIWYTGVGMDSAKNETAMDFGSIQMDGVSMEEDIYNSTDDVNGNVDFEMEFNGTTNEAKTESNIIEFEETTGPVQLKKVGLLATEEFSAFTLEQFPEDIRMSLEVVVEHAESVNYYVKDATGDIYVELDNTFYYVEGLVFEQ